MTWAILAVIAAFGQALSWAIKKKALENTGLDNSLGALSFFVAALILFVAYFVQTGSFWTEGLPREYWLAAMAVIVLNIIAVRAMFTALNADVGFNTIMPFTAVTSLTIVPMEFFLRHMMPNLLQIIGITLVVIGAVIYAYKTHVNLSARIVKYFTIAALCYSLAPVFMGVAVDISGSGLFSAAVFHLGIAVGFTVMLLLVNEQKTWLGYSRKTAVRIALVMMGAGVVTALVVNGPATVALQHATAAEVFGVKRLMPFFALIIGHYYFKEKVTARMIFGVTLLVAGSVMIIWFR